MISCTLASGRTSLRCVCMLHDGAVSILSPPVPPAQSPAERQLLRLDEPAEAIACSTDGALLAVASHVGLCVYCVDEGLAIRRCWSAPLHAHVRGLAISPAAASGVVVAVAGAPGLSLLDGEGASGSASGKRDAADEGGGAALVRRRVLHAGHLVCGCALPLHIPQW